jgi:hypothetical protein
MANERAKPSISGQFIAWQGQYLITKEKRQWVREEPLSVGRIYNIFEYLDG